MCHMGKMSMRNDFQPWYKLPILDRVGISKLAFNVSKMWRFCIDSSLYLPISLIKDFIGRQQF